jgi:hypothetical protein
LGDRFYAQQRDTLGTCPGIKTKTKKYGKKMAWTNEKREQVIKMYEDAEPTSETSVEIVKQIAEELEESANGVRIILSKAEVYIKKTPDSKSPSSGSTSKRVSKADQQESLIDAITDMGEQPDIEIINKLSGKAATYLAGIVRKANGSETDVEED